jgi:hypothetical protein
MYTVSNEGLWKDHAPRTRKQRKELLDHCGDECFLVPSRLAYPICNKKETDRPCTYHCRGISGAEHWASFHQDKAVLEKSRALSKRLGCGYDTLTFHFTPWLFKAKGGLITKKISYKTRLQIGEWYKRQTKTMLKIYSLRLISLHVHPKENVITVSLRFPRKNLAESDIYPDLFADVDDDGNHPIRLAGEEFFVGPARRRS